MDEQLSMLSLKNGQNALKYVQSLNQNLRHNLLQAGFFTLKNGVERKNFVFLP
ncbi:hypothetical protein [Segatella buccae]|uniref:hypothetical protein n=1 Tax=Segatella buccae TaxID=28126 RepID=UPI0028D6B81B|nr:hypothetical protein [Segatella buccae]